jgi:hypothetical protein
MDAIAGRQAKRKKPSSPRTAAATIAIAMRRIIESSGWLMSHSICDGDVEFPNMAKLPQLWTTLHTFVDPSRAAAREYPRREASINGTISAPLLGKTR